VFVKKETCKTLLTTVVLASLALACAPTPTGTPTPRPKPTEPPPTPRPEEPVIKQWSSPPPMTIDPSKQYFATFKTAKGDIKVQLFADKAPKTVNSFVFLAREGFYNNITFHRVLADFMAQGGDPTGKGSGGPGYIFDNESHPDLTFDSPGILAMANAGANTNGSQFFITFRATPWLDAGYTIFGKVIEGMDVVLSLRLRNPAENPTYPGDLLKIVEIEEKG